MKLYLSLLAIALLAANAAAQTDDDTYFDQVLGAIRGDLKNVKVPEKKYVLNTPFFRREAGIKLHRGVIHGLENAERVSTEVRDTAEGYKEFTYVVRLVNLSMDIEGSVYYGSLQFGLNLPAKDGYGVLHVKVLKSPERGIRLLRTVTLHNLSGFHSVDFQGTAILRNVLDIALSFAESDLEIAMKHAIENTFNEALEREVAERNKSG